MVNGKCKKFQLEFLRNNLTAKDAKHAKKSEDS